MRTRHHILAALATLALAPAPAYASSVTWSGTDPASADWNDAANWSGSFVPTGSDGVVINNGFGPVIGSSGTGDMIYVNGLTIATGGAGLGSLSLVNSASVTVTAETRLGQQSTGTTTISMSGSSYLFLGNAQSGGDGNTSQHLFIDLTENAYLRVGGQLQFYGGTTFFNASDSSTLDVTYFRLGRTAASRATATFSGSSRLLAVDVEVGYVFGNGVLNLTDFATATLMGNMIIGVTDARGVANPSYVYLSGSAQLNINVTGAMNVGQYGPGEIHISDHAKATADYIRLGAFRSTGTTAHGSGIIGLHGDAYGGRGTLNTYSITRGAGTAGTILFNGGILRANAANTEFLNANSDILTVFIDEEGGYVDSNGFDIGFTPGVIVTGSGAFNKIGAGNLTLSGSVSHTGAIVVQEGGLILTQAHQLATNEAVNVKENALLKAASIDQTLTGLSGNGLIDIDAGALTLNNDADSAFFGQIIAAGGLIKTGSGAISLHGDNTLGMDTTISDGRLGIAHSNALGATTITLTGNGSLRADANVSIANSIRAVGASLNFDTLGDATMFVNGLVTGNQGIVKEGAGTINLVGSSSGVTGAVSVNEGTLTVTGLGAGATVTVANGAGFGGSGSVASVSYSGAGALQIGSTHNDSLIVTPVTLTITNGLTLGDSVLKFDTYSDNVSDKLIADNITFGATTGIDFSMLRQGTYTLVETTAGAIASALPSELQFNTTRTGFAKSDRENFTYALSPDQKTLSVTITKTNEALTWTGAGGDTWDYNNTSSWSGNDTKFVDGDRIAFASAVGSSTITIDGNSVTAADVTVTGNDNYLFTGDGRITTDAASTGGKGTGFGADATGKFTMQGTGTITFANASNAFLGGLDIQAGTVIGNAVTLGKNATITNNSTLIFQQDTNDTFLGSLRGAGSYAKAGIGTLTFTASDSSYTGIFTINEGSLILAEGAKLADIDIAAGALFGGSGSAANVIAHAGSTVRVGIAVAGSQVGTETLTLETLTLGNTARITGAGTLAANIAIDSGNTGIAEIAENRELVLSGSITGAGGFTKQGLGTLNLMQKATHSGATTIAAGTLKVAAPDILSAHSPHIVKLGATLHLNGYNQTLYNLVNEGTVSIGAKNTAGARLTLANGYHGVENNVGTIHSPVSIPSRINFSLQAMDDAPTLVDQIIVQGGDITGRTELFFNVIDLRADPDAFGAYLNDIPALIINEAGDMPSNVFTLAPDDKGSRRIVIGMHDYRLYTYENELRLIARDSAEIPAVLAINPISIAVNRATLNSIAQRLDSLRDLQTAADSHNRDKGLWLQGYYRRDRFYGNYWSTTNGAQVGFDIPTDTTRDGTVTYGVFADYTNSRIEIADIFNNPSVTLDSKSLGAYMALQHENWCVDFVAKHTWDDYTINVADTPEFSTTGASWGGFARLSYTLALKGGWTLVPQTQLIFQARGVNDAKDAYGRTYTFGQKYARIDEANSLEGRISLSARKLITLKSGKVLHPWITFGYFNDFKGDMTVTTLNNYEFIDDLGGSSFQLNIGTSAQLSKRLTAIIDAAIQNGGKIDSYSFNAGLSYRW